MRQFVSNLCVPAVLFGCCGLAIAAPRETASFQNVDSFGEDGDLTNAERTFSFVGGYEASRVRLTGTLQALNAITWQVDPRIEITPPLGSPLLIQPFTTGNEFTTATVTDRVFVLPAPVAAAGQWTFRFFEAVQDGATADARWTSVSFTLDDEGLAPPTVLTPSQTGVYTEVEDNDSKPRANRIEILATGQSISGVTTGSSSEPGVQSYDYFRVRTAAAPLAIYRHRLTLSSSPNGHVGSLRGLTQDEGTILTGSDIALQSTSSSTSPPRLSQWYGFGKQEEVYYRVAGGVATTAPYTAAYSVSTVAPIDAPRIFTPGTMTITTIGQGHATDTDLWVYDGQLNPLPGLGNDDDEDEPNNQSTVMAEFPQGEYYIAIAPYNLANNLASTGENEGWFDGDVTDFPNAVVQSSTTGNVNVSLSVADAAGTVPIAATRVGPYDVVWIKLVVGQPPATCPADLDDGSGQGTPDDAVTIDDLLYFLVAFENGTEGADLDNDGDPAQGVPDGAVTIDDLLFFLFRFEAGC